MKPPRFALFITSCSCERRLPVRTARCTRMATLVPGWPTWRLSTWTPSPARVPTSTPSCRPSTGHRPLPPSIRASGFDSAVRSRPTT
ncbi:hypothetical protein BC831DRAFT_450192 [Entophlyctis helioformis]|nr:hypothetical protein BC831DRAFT_450192 [Entophlyctis helioformis]